MRNRLPRRNFLKAVLATIIIFLASCRPRINRTLTPTLTFSSTKTDPPQPTTTNTSTLAATETASPTNTPTSTTIPCFHLLTPENGVKLNEITKINFSWELMPGAASYLLEIFLPTQQILIYGTTYTNWGQYTDALKSGGVYYWRVTALDASKNTICETEKFSFSKLEHVPFTKTSTFPPNPTEYVPPAATAIPPPNPTEYVPPAATAIPPPNPTKYIPPAATTTLPPIPIDDIMNG